MNETTHLDRNALFLEIARYLAAVDLYRAEHCEPTWLPESTTCRTFAEHPQPRAEHAPSAH